jgi:hypothetical protein
MYPRISLKEFENGGKYFMPHEKVIENIESEIKRIEKLIENYVHLLKKVKTKKPDFIELGSLAMLLHSFYNGLENVFTCIAKEIDGKMPKGETWHSQLLEQMIKPTGKRTQAVLSNDTYKDLEEYLGFRHFSRHAYAFDLEWQLMKDLVKRIEDVKKRTLDEIKLFISKIKQNNE